MKIVLALVLLVVFTGKVLATEEERYIYPGFKSLFDSYIQTDNQYPVPYKVTLSRYHIEATRAQYRTSTPIDMDIYYELCRDEDGCSITLAMKNWHATNDAVASRGPYRLFASVNTNFWRLSNTDSENEDGNGVIRHVLNAWDCFFTDGEYLNGVGSDVEVQMNLLNWQDSFSRQELICSLTITD